MRPPTRRRRPRRPAPAPAAPPQLYKWHNDSREAIELAYDSCLQQSFNTRNKYGIKLPGLRQVRRRRPNPLSRLGDLLDPMVSAKSLLNEGFIYGALCALCLTGMDQSLPLTGAFAYSVYKFQSKRAKAAEAEAEDNGGEEPQGAAKPIVGAILMTGLSLAVGVGLMALVTGPLARFIPPDMVSNLGTTCLVATMGLFSTFLK